MKTLLLVSCFIARIAASTSLAADPAEANDPIVVAFQEAMAARNSGEIARALDIFDKILTKNPNLPKVRLALAECHEELGNKEVAIGFYQQVLASNPPEGVQQHVQARLSTLTQSFRPPSPATAHGKFSEERMVTNTGGAGNSEVNAEFSVGLLYDTNVPAGPASDPLPIFNKLFAHGGNSQGHSDWGLQAQASVSASYTLNESLSLSTTFDYNRVDYAKLNCFDYDGISTSFGPVLNGQNRQLALLCGYGANFLGGQLDNQNVSLTGQWIWQFKPQWTSAFCVSASLGKNEQFDGRSGESFTLSESVQWNSKDGRHFVSPRLFYAHENTKSKYEANDQVGCGIGFSATLPWKLRLHGEPSCTYIKYDRQESFCGNLRSDVQLVFNVNIARPLGLLGVEGALGFTYTRNVSNADQFNYKRSQFTFTVRRSW